MNIINEKIMYYLNGLYEPLNKELEELRKYAENKHIPIILKDTEELMVLLLKIFRPDNILEIGTAIGYSTGVMAETLKNSKITTIERYIKSYNDAQENLKNLNLNKNITFLHGDGEEKLEELLHKVEKNEIDKFDFVFIDAGKSHYKTFWDIIVKIVKPKGLIVCDNVLLKGTVAEDASNAHRRLRTSIKKMQDFLKYIKENKNFDTTILAVGDGVSISIVKE